MEPYKKGQNLLEVFVWPIDTGRLMGDPIDMTPLIDPIDSRYLPAQQPGAD